VALALDGLIVAAMGALFLALAAAVVLLQTDWLADDPSRGEWLSGYLVAALWLPAQMAYFGIGASRRGTLGQRALGLRVCDRRGHAPGGGRAMARVIAQLLAVAPLGLGLLAPLVDGQRRSLADRATATRVWEPAS
jgi:uncharacterized RDD family membrane protein YckC